VFVILTSEAVTGDTTTMERFYREFGRRIRDAREAAGLSQEQLAQHVTMSRASIANIERGAQRVALHQWLQFADALAVEPMKLVPGIGRSEGSLERALRSERVPAAMANWIEQAVAQRKPRIPGTRGADDGDAS